MNLSSDQIQRYARHIMLKEIGGPGQQKLLGAKVAMIGAGGLGGPAALYLAAAGVGSIQLIDDDDVSLSNLQRQILFSSEEVGISKVHCGEKRLKSLNPDCKVIAVNHRFTPENATECIGDADYVLDGSDSFQTRFDVNQFCHENSRTLISGAVGRWSGQVSVYKSGLTKDKDANDKHPCYRCLTPELPETEVSCAEIGVIGPLTGIVGARMAMETVKEIANAGQSMAGRLWIYDGLSGDSRNIKLPVDPACPCCGKQ